MSDLAIAKAIQLEPVAPGRSRRRDLGGTNRGERREAHHRPRGLRRTRHLLFAALVDESLEGDRCNEYRRGYLAAEDRRPGRNVRDVDQDPGTKRPPRKGGDVVAQRPLVTGSPREVPVDLRFELLLRKVLELRDVEGAGHGRDRTFPSHN